MSPDRLWGRFTVCSQGTGWSIDIRNTNPTIHSPALSTGTPPQHLNSACIYSGLDRYRQWELDRKLSLSKHLTVHHQEPGNAPEWRNLKWGWDFADTCALHVRKFLPFPLSFLFCWEKPNDRTTGWWPQKMIKAPHFPACPRWLQLTDSRLPKSLRWELRMQCCSSGRGNMKQPLGTEFQYTAFEKKPGENQLFFHTEAWMCLSAAQTQNESWKHIPRHQRLNPAGFSVWLWNTIRLNVQRGL